jgi:hypothetical protein
MKMRVLYSSPKGKMATFAAAIAESQNCGVDVIPPAYACDKERLVIIGLSLKKEPENALRLFCRELDKTKTQHVAIFTDNAPDAPALKSIKETLREAGTTLIGEVLTVEGGLPFKFAKKITPEEKAAVIKWTEEVMSKIQ